MKPFWAMAAFLLAVPFLTGLSDAVTESKMGGSVFAAGFAIGIIYCAVMEKVFSRETK